MLLSGFEAVVSESKQTRVGNPLEIRIDRSIKAPMELLNWAAADEKMIARAVDSGSQSKQKRQNKTEWPTMYAGRLEDGQLTSH